MIVSSDPGINCTTYEVGILPPAEQFLSSFCVSFFALASAKNDTHE
jgi:hypothetical protein